MIEKEGISHNGLKNYDISYQSITKNTEMMCQFFPLLFTDVVIMQDIKMKKKMMIMIGVYVFCIIMNIKNELDIHRKKKK